MQMSDGMLKKCTGLNFAKDIRKMDIMTKCKIIESTLTDEQNNERTVYGFQFTDGDSGIVIKTVEDISDDLKMLQKLMREINEGNVSVLHIDDIIADTLGF